ncbi:chemotaxis-specific protein-glutamate methyltransferase CheB [Brachyspira sp. G79]|uniref:chemotaxis-specific protein-glutamate methyltransferase CheB n=1 Tax=Brachyspira sp. G79 TaxID=1358104 RepID=UPI000BBB9823|nr:chemotaxis-specific protein-glutamate methyltransferase CheB [Brachyspira sp. G79]PCG20172.1 chemotaxis protein [Brachyspira sp. G79]
MLGAIRVLIAEDSKIISGMLNNILANHYRINVVSLVNNGIDAYKSIVSIKPDFVVIEIDLPLMGGIELLKLLKKENIQVNILVMTSLTKNKDLSSRALELGALDIIYKPRNVSIDFLKENVLNKIIAISKNNRENGLEFVPESNIDYKFNFLNKNTKKVIDESEKTEIDKFDDNVRIIPFNQKQVATAITKVLKFKFNTPKLVAIGISTGGPRALRIMLPSIPADFPLPILISQHIPKDFSSSLISSLQDICSIRIKEASLDEELMPSVVYISPGDKNMGIYMDSAGRLKIKFYPDTEKKFIYTPCVDYLFNTIDDVLTDKAIAIVMTGMGNDGTEGMIKLHDHNNLTIAQDRASSTVYGMPRSVIENKAVHLVLSLYDIAEFLIQYMRLKIR